MADPVLPPLPDLDNPFTAPFWQAARERRLVMPHCPACSHIQWPPRPVCGGCLGELTADDWREIAQTGTIWSFVVYHRAFHPGFADVVPYNVAFVKLDAGPIFVTNIVDGNDLTIGENVTARFDDSGGNVTLVRFFRKDPVTKRGDSQ